MSSRKNRSPEEQARRAKIRELLQESNISSMADIQDLFRETIAEFMENGLDAELDNELGYSKYDYTKTRTRTTAETGTAARRCAPASVTLRFPCPAIEKENLTRRY